MKWIVLGGKDQEVRFLCLSEYLNAAGVKNEVEFSHPPVDDFLLELERQISRVDQVRIQSPFGDQVPNFQNRSTALASLLGSADAMIKKSDGSWWPENLLFEAFTLEFIQKAKNMDLNSYALIVGSGTASKVVIGALVTLGFSKFYIADRFEPRAKASIQRLKRNFFNIEFSYIAPAGLMLLPGSSTVLVNATPLVPDNDILKDLYYFNFLKPPSTIIDLNLVPPSPPLIDEGKSVGAQVISGYEIASRADALWVRKALGIPFDEAAYLKFLEKKLGEVPFDPAPYKLN